MTIAEFLLLVKKFFEGGEEAVRSTSKIELQGLGLTSSSTSSFSSINDAETSLVRTAWAWLISRPEVLIGGSKRWNDLDFDEILALPLQNPTKREPIQEEPPPGHPTPRKAVAKANNALTTQPRIFVTEETIWKRLTGHCVDYKRVPNLEWKCLLGIASARREGILQGDLRVLVDQDKRSVPKRTDFLADKGYIVKRSLFAQGTKTSKLWLADLAPPSTIEGQAHASRFDLSRAYLTKNTTPVAWHQRWTGRDIDVEAFVETLIAIIKAWGVMRYTDLRLKMGVEELRWQMRAMSRLCRKLVDMGILKYALAAFPNSKKVWKDCIKFIRDPTEEEWDQILATGKKSSKLSQVAKDGQSDLEPNMTRERFPDNEVDEEEHEDTSGILPLPNNWVPEKPVVQTILDVIQGSSPRGASNPQISASTVGYNFRRYIGTCLNNFANHRQPENLARFQISSDLVRNGKVSTYMYTLKGTISSMTLGGHDGSIRTKNGKSSKSQATSGLGSPYGFGSSSLQQLSRAGGSTLSDLSRAVRTGLGKPHKRPKLPSKEPYAIGEEIADPVGKEASGGRSMLSDDVGRPSKRRRIDRDDAIELQSSTESNPGTDIPAVLAPETEADLLGTEPAELLPGRPPGIYIGEPHSLNPRRKRLGRPKRSLVIIFRSDRLKMFDILQQRTVNNPESGSHQGQDKQQDKTVHQDEPLDDLSASKFQDISLEVHYNSSPGVLLLQCDGRKLLFSPESAEGGSAAIALDDLASEGLSIRRCDQDGHRILACTVSDADEHGSPKTFEFFFRNDFPTLRRAISLRARTMHLKTGLVPEYITQLQSTSSVTKSEGGKAPKRKRKKGHASKDGRSGSEAGPYRCDSCGGIWKNELGLKYHLTKAQTPCNPDYVPQLILDTPKNQPRISSLLLPPSEESNAVIAEQNFASDGRRTTARAKKSRRLKMGTQLVMNPGLNFRGLAVDDYLPQHEARQGTEDNDSSPLPSTAGNVVSGRGPSSDPFQHEAFTRLSVDLRDILGTDVPVIEDGWHRHPPYVSTPQSTELDSQIDRVSRQGEALAKVPGNREQPRPNFVPDGHLEDTSQSISNAAGGRPLAATDMEASTQPQASYRYPSPPLNWNIEPISSLDTSRAIRPFRPTIDYSRIPSESKVKTLQAMEIIEYLLDNNGGVFPGGRALFYAILRVFLQAFSRQNPPTLKNCRIALKNLSRDGKAREIVHGFKDMMGRIITSSIIIRSGISPTGNAPTILKKQIQEAHPSLFIPEAFSPSELELRVLEELEKTPSEAISVSRNGPKFRGRRDQPGDVELLDAPYYSHGQSRSGVTDSPDRRRHSLDRRSVLIKHPRESDADGWRDETGVKRLRGMSNSLTNPSQQIDLYGGLDRQDESPTVESLTPPWTNQPLVDVTQPSRYGEALYTPDQRPPNEEPPSVLEAIRAFDLLPLKGNWSIFHKFPASAGMTKYIRRPNPGLDSLPDRFFRSTSTRAKRNDSGNLPDLGNESTAPEPLEWRTMQGYSTRESHRNNLPITTEDILSKIQVRSEKPGTWADLYWKDFCQVVEAIEGWELSEAGTHVLLETAVTPGEVFIHTSADPARVTQAPVFPKWTEENMFDIETLPYYDLPDDLGSSGVNKSKKSTVTPGSGIKGRPPTNPARTAVLNRLRKSLGHVDGSSPLRAMQVGALSKVREHTPYPRTAEECVIQEGSKDGRDDWYNDNTRLAAFVCVTTLTGGVSRSVDWGLLLRLFPASTLSNLRKFWTSVRKDQQSTVIRWSEIFQKEFLKAYENNEVPPIDYDNLLSYDWRSLTLWTRRLLLNKAETAGLPASLEELNARGLTVEEPKHRPRDWRETYFLPIRSYFDKFQDTSSEAIAAPLTGVRDRTLDDLTLAMSWIRSLCVTPPRRYQSNSIKEKLRSIRTSATESTRLIEQATVILQDQSMIAKSTRKSATGRVWRLHDRVFKVLDKASQGEKYSKAVELKKELDTAFRRGQKKLVRYVCNDGMIMAILNLQAYQRIRVETTGQPYVPMGYEPFNYETRKYPKKYHHFRMHMSPTTRYLYDDAPELADLRQRVASSKPPGPGCRGEIPLWCDIFGRPDARLWRKVLGSVLFMLAARGAMRADELAAALRPVVLPFEAQMILDWGEHMGVLKAQMPNTALAPVEWWWLVIDALQIVEKNGPADGNAKSSSVGSGADAAIVSMGDGNASEGRQ
ncbi:hypothetical protein VTK73DRAFT_510 [Phialemonium thermophilum]|uniref:TFIIIC transcription initiation factor complex subunits Tfc3 n=1 Tax=Phialemonium thermophilum TaxID=223376 RepID=A0ABR3Y596_9PEZI